MKEKKKYNFSPEEERKAFSDKCFSSLLFFAKEVLDMRDISQKTHGDIIKMLESNNTRKLICVPRGCLKSSIACVAYPMWLTIKYPNVRILIDSELHTNSCTFIREIKAHYKSGKFLYLFGDFEGAVWSQSEIIVNKRVKRLKEPTIMAGGIGTTKVGQHVDYIIADDMNSPSNTNTVDNAQKVIDHFKYNISILEPTGTYVVIGTRYASNDVIGHILEHEPNNYGVTYHTE